MTKKFLFGIAAIVIVYVIGAWWIAKGAVFNPQQAQGLIYSGILATLNVIAAYFIIIIAIPRGQKEFAKIFLSGMVVRLLILLGLIFMILKFCAVDHFTFISSLFILYIIYQIWEILFLNSSVKKEK